MTASHHAVLIVLCLILGSCVGSFLNVCVYRIPKAMSLFRPRSRCPRCLTAIRARDNIPVLGWLILGGKCRHCRGAISPRYATVELIVGLLFAGVYLAAVSLARGDLWEQAGAWRVLVLLLASWAVIGSVVVAALIGSDTRRASRSLTQGRGVGG
jgi:leader peptidase (prepilin peptidase)/N-methyltransferase